MEPTGLSSNPSVESVETTAIPHEFKRCCAIGVVRIYCTYMHHIKHVYCILLIYIEPICITYNIRILYCSQAHTIQRIASVFLRYTCLQLPCWYVWQGEHTWWLWCHTHPGFLTSQQSRMVMCSMRQRWYLRKMHSKSKQSRSSCGRSNCLGPLTTCLWCISCVLYPHFGSVSSWMYVKHEKQIRSCM